MRLGNFCDVSYSMAARTLFSKEGWLTGHLELSKPLLHGGPPSIVGPHDRADRMPTRAENCSGAQGLFTQSFNRLGHVSSFLSSPIFQVRERRSEEWMTSSSIRRGI